MYQVRFNYLKRMTFLKGSEIGAKEDGPSEILESNSSFTILIQ